MFPIDIGLNTLKVKITVTFNVDSQYVNFVTRVWLGTAFFKFDKGNSHMVFMFPVDLGVNWVNAKVTVTFSIDC